jgi:hypothetical protein
MEYKSFMEALKGKQHKIDKNKNGKVDAHDFQLLRKEESELNEVSDQAKSLAKEIVSKHRNMKTDVHRGNVHIYNKHDEEAVDRLVLAHTGKDKEGNDRFHLHRVHSSAEDSDYRNLTAAEVHAHASKHIGGRIKESTELDEIHRMKTKLNKLDAVSNKSVARQKLSNLMKSGKARGALIANKMRTLNMGDDIDQETLDALHEVLSKDATASDYISDFVHSTNPKFDGKSKKERINMALGSYYDTHKKKDGISEETEQVEEGVFADEQGIAKKLVDKHGKNVNANDIKLAIHMHPEGHKTTHERIAGHVKSMLAVKEEVEELDEKSDQAKQNKTMKNTMDASRGARYKLNNPVPDADPEHKTAQAHNKAIGRALRNEDKMTTTKDKSGKLISFKYEGDWKKSTEKKQGSGKAANLAGQAMQKMAKANEEYISEEEYNNLSLDEQALYERTEKSLGKRAADMHNAASHIGYGANAGSTRKDMSSAKKDFRKIGKSIAKTHGKDVAKQAGAAAHDNAFMGNASAGASDKSHEKFYSSLSDKEKKAYTTRNQKHGLEEAKDEQEYGYEGDMALNQLATLTRCAEMIKEILKPDTDMPEWVQSKITLATDYIQTAADYMHSEMNEAKSVEVKVNHAGDAPHEEKWEPVKKIKKPVAEAVQKVDIPAYLRKAKGDTPLKMDDLKRKDTLSDAENLKRNRGVKESFDDEGNLISNKVSYKEFMLEYTPGPGGVTQIKGRSYGASYSDPEGADDYDDKKPMKPAAEKRGRGRPAGAKSGARKITGTSKLMNK